MNVARARWMVREVGLESQEALLQLARRCDTGTDRFSVDRGPDFFALPGFFGEHRTWGVFDPRGRLAGCMGASVQRRLFGGRAVEVDYLHDLRVDPDFRRTSACVRLIGRVAEALPPGRPRLATILDDNGRSEALVRYAERRFGRARRLASTAHVLVEAAGGVPSYHVTPVSRETWERAYSLWAPGVNGAPDLATCRRAGGELLGARDLSGHVVAVCALVDQRGLRTLRDPAGAVVPVLYPAFFASSERNRDALEAFAIHAANASRGALVAVGRPSCDAPRAALTSTTWGFGPGASELPPLDAHELTLI